MSNQLTYIQGYAKGACMLNTQKAINALMNIGSGIEFTMETLIMHSTKVAYYLLAFGIDDDHVVAAALLHDCIRFNKDSSSAKLALLTYGLDEDTLSLTATLNTQVDGSSLESLMTHERYNAIRKDPRAALVTLADICQLSHLKERTSMNLRMDAYVQGIRTYILPLCSIVKDKLTYYADAVNCMEIQIDGLCDLATTIDHR